jgi:ATP:corrinoid adenosyltransferase
VIPRAQVTACVAALLDLVDYVTELRPLRHPFECGVPARKGVEY